MIADEVHLVRRNSGVGQVGDDKSQVAAGGEDGGEETQAREQTALGRVDGHGNLAPAWVDGVGRAELCDEKEAEGGTWHGGPGGLLLEAVILGTTIERGAKRSVTPHEHKTDVAM